MANSRMRKGEFSYLHCQLKLKARIFLLVKLNNDFITASGNIEGFFYTRIFIRPLTNELDFQLY